MSNSNLQVKANSNLQILRPATVCELLGGIHISTLYRWMDEGKFPLEKVQLGPRAVGFRESEIEAWLERHTEDKQPETA